MASSEKKPRSSIFCSKFKVFFLTLMYLSGFCHGKALLEETPKSRGKRFNDYRQQSELYQAYPQNYYYPKVNGQPIYVPAIEQSASHFNEFLDDYYKSFAQPWELVTPAPQGYDSSKLAYNPASPSENLGNYELSAGGQSPLTYQKDSLLKEVKHKDSQYYTPEVGEKNVKYDSNESETKPELHVYEKPALLEHLDKDETYEQEYDTKITLKPESEYEDRYQPPVIRQKYKQKYPYVPEVDPELEKVKDYEKPALSEYLDKSKVENYDQNTEVKPESEYEDQYEPPIIRQKYKQKSDKLHMQKEQSFPKTDLKLEEVDYEQPIVHKKIKEEKTETKPQQGKRVKVTSKTGYKNVETQSTKKRSKGKLNPQISKKHGQIAEVLTEDSTLDSETDYVTSNKFNEKDGSLKLADYEPKEYPAEAVNLKHEVHPIKTKEKVVKTKPQKPPVKTKGNVAVKTESIEPAVKIKEKVVVKTESKEPAVKIKEKVVVKTESKEPAVKIKEKVVVKTKPKEPAVKIKEKVVVKTESKEPAVKVKEKVVVKTKPKEPSIKIKEKLVVKTKPKEPSIKTNGKITKTEKKGTSKTDQKDSDYESHIHVDRKDDFGDTDIAEDDSSDYEGSFKESTEGTLGEKWLDEHETNKDEQFNTDKVNFDDSEKISNDAVNNEVSMNIPKFLPNRDSILSLSSLNSNILSLVFNPNASPLKLKKCLTRSNETGYCKYVQHCDVPQIATSLEQLLNNACVIDDIFIGVCCPEFPVETVKVQWEQSPSDSDKRNEDEFGHNPEDCGIRSDEASNQQSWPWKAPLVSMSNGKIFCGGVLINEEYVLTAAHCTTKIPKNQILVRLGQFDDSSGEDFAVVEIKRHAQYNSRTMHNDIALLKLGRRVMHDHHTGVICLPEDGEEDTDDYEGEKATLLGWRGIFGTKSKDPEFLEVMSNEECTKKLGMKVPSSLLCTEARTENERTCNADSGAPLVIKDDGKYEVIGILSWNRNDCNQRFPSTFSRVSTYVGWIQKHAI